jgi:hypothetical protein
MVGGNKEVAGDIMFHLELAEEAKEAEKDAENLPRAFEGRTEQARIREQGLCRSDLDQRRREHAE